MTHESIWDKFYQKIPPCFLQIEFLASSALIKCKVSRISQLGKWSENSSMLFSLKTSIEKGNLIMWLSYPPYNLPLSFLSYMTLKIIMIMSSSTAFFECEHFRCCHVILKFSLSINKIIVIKSFQAWVKNLHETQLFPMTMIIIRIDNFWGACWMNTLSLYINI